MAPTAPCSSDHSQANARAGSHPGPGPRPLKRWQSGLAPPRPNYHPDLAVCRAQAEKRVQRRERPIREPTWGRCHPSCCPARPRGAKCRSLAGCVRSPQEGGKEAGGAFTTRRGTDRSDKEEGSRRRCGSELTTPQTAGVLQLASRRGLQKWRPREGRLRPLPAVCRKPR